MKILIAATTVVLVSSFARTADVDEGLEPYKIGVYEKAVSVWGPLAEQGDAEAQCNLGVLYKNGQGVNKDFNKAFEWYKLSAEQGYADNET